MKQNQVDQSTPAKAFTALLFALFLGYSGNCLAASCTDTMTIKIYNNSCQPSCMKGEQPYNIYPVLQTGQGAVDQWMQAVFNVAPSQIGNPDFAYPRGNDFRLYFTPTGDGIKPGGNITVTLPLCTQLAKSVNPKLPDQYIDWWNGGQILIYDAPAGNHKPPADLTADYTKRTGQIKVTPVDTAVPPKCPACLNPLQIFKDPADLPKSDPDQLIEYTLGSNQVQPATAPQAYVLDVHHVDYDVSYVNVAYTPAAMEPVNNPAVGYIGTTQSISTFKSALDKFLGASSPWKGWPQFVDSNKQNIGKVPSALEIFARLACQPNVAPPPDLTPLPPPPVKGQCVLWPPVEQLKTNWNNCTQKSATAPICSLMVDVNKLFEANYQQYLATYAAKGSGCDVAAIGTPPLKPSEPQLLSHVYGWGSFNDHCPATFNLLENTKGYFTEKNGTFDYTGYQTVKNEFDQLQYWPNPDPAKIAGTFDPWVVLIHGAGYVDAPFVYAFSVDDGVGNMNVDGDGLVIAVGGGQGLPNPNHATPPINVGIGHGPQTYNFTHYGLCTLNPTTPINYSYASFSMSANDLATCPISLVDNHSPPRLYTFTLKSQPPFPPLPNPKTLPPGYASLPANFAPVDCSGNKPKSSAATWCYDFMSGTGGFLRGVFTWTQKGLLGADTDQHNVVVPAAPQ